MGTFFIAWMVVSAIITFGFSLFDWLEGNFPHSNRITNDMRVKHVIMFIMFPTLLIMFMYSKGSDSSIGEFLNKPIKKEK